MSDCQLCGEPVDPWERQMSIGMLAHNACGLRSVIGGIGHLTDHDFWCGVMHDPDAGLSYRQSALQVDEWVREHGVPNE